MIQASRDYPVVVSYYCSRQKYCLLQLDYWTLERITICQARSYEDQDWESLKQENPKSTNGRLQTKMVLFPSNTGSVNTSMCFLGIPLQTEAETGITYSNHTPIMWLHNYHVTLHWTNTHHVT